MNDQQLDNKVHQDTAKVKLDLSTLAGDGAARFGRFEESLTQAAGKAKEDLTIWVEEGVSQLSGGIEKLTDEARDSVVDAAATVKKEVGHGLIQYNAKAQEAANKLPGGFSEKAAKYPWVTISVALGAGLVLGSLIESAWHRLQI